MKDETLRGEEKEILCVVKETDRQESVIAFRAFGDDNSDRFSIGKCYCHTWGGDGVSLA